MSAVPWPGRDRPGGRPGGQRPRSPDVVGLLRDDVLAEWYRYPPGPPMALPSHAHEEYQFCLNLGLPGIYRYRGADHVVPAPSVSAVMPGEAHSPRDGAARDRASGQFMLYVPPALISDAAASLSAQRRPGRRGLPAFRHLILDDAALASRFAALHLAMADPATPALDTEVRLLSVLTGLVARHARITPERARRPAHQAVRRARDYLHENRTTNVTLAKLAVVSELSPYRLTRLFTETMGVPPHAYQIQLRIEHAKRLLLTGRPVSDAAHETGFFDLSHFTRHFKRYVGVAPGAYAQSSGVDRRAQRAERQDRTSHAAEHSLRS